MSSKLCPYCMRMTEEETCPYCGKSIHYAGQPMHLPAGYVVSGKHPYVLGAALGQGGFGITYIALDMVSGKRVAIKEFFPTYCAGRTAGITVSSYQNQDEVYRKGKERFLDEARTLKSLSDLKNIVNVLDFFEANNAAYLVMEFLEGRSLKDTAAANGKFPARQFLAQIRPLMEDIQRMHERGVIHRDISPDNIMLMPDGQMKLIDFGSARSYVGDKSMTVVVKKGFAPVEQYISKGSTAATDVYALAATIYYCITGKVPTDSAERQYDSKLLERPSALGADISRVQEEALFKALEVQPQARTQSIQEFLDALSAREPVRQEPAQEAPVQPDNEKQEPKKDPVLRLPDKKWIRIGAAAAVLAVVLLVIALLPSNKTNDIVVAETLSTSPVIRTGNWQDNVLMADPLSALDQIPRESIQSVTFLDTCAEAPADALDVSEGGSGTVLAWAEKNGSCYDVYLAGEGGINAVNACSSLFLDCVSLQTVHFGSAFRTDYVTNMSGMFENCIQLNELDVSSWDTSNVTSMRSMFHHCAELTDLDVSNWNTSGVTNMDSMFYQCENLSALDLSSWDISSGETYQDFMSDGKQINGKPWEEFFLASKWIKQVMMADPLSALQQIPRAKIQRVTFLDTCADAPADAFDVSQNKNGTVLAWAEKSGSNYHVFFAGEGGINAVNACSNLFADCTALKTVQFGNAFRTDQVTNMSGMFKNCSQLTELDAGSLNTSHAASMSSMFYHCSALTTLDLSGWDTSSVTNIGRMFDSCRNLKNLDVSTWNTSSVTAMGYTFFGCTKLVTVDVSNWDLSNVTDIQGMFRSCDNLTTLDVSNWNTSNVISMRSMFLDCGKLSDLDVSSWDTSSVTDMSWIFYYCGKLSTLDVSGWDTSSVTDMSSMFAYCWNLAALDVSGWDTSSVTNMGSMFHCCSKLVNLDISNWDVSSVTNYHNFMSKDKSINGKHWMQYFKA